MALTGSDSKDDLSHDYEKELDLEHISLDTQELRNDARNLCNLVKRNNHNNPFQMVKSRPGCKEYDSDYS